jgi:glycosyltransferase involved in cell wall biosynthesis
VANKPKKVLHVILDLKYGGMQRLLLALLSRLDREAFEVEVLVLDPESHLVEEMAAICPVHVMGRMERGSMLRPRRLAKKIATISPDIVHTHSGTWYKVSLAARMAGVPSIIYTDHGRQHPDPRIGRFLDSRASRRTTAIVSVSETVRSQLRRFVSQPEDISVILNGVDCDFFCPGELTRDERCELGLPESSLILGSIGRLEPVKGYDIMIDALGELRAALPDGEMPVLVIVGDGSESGPLRERVERQNLGEQVLFFGWRDDIPDLLRAFDVFSLSSRSEGTSLSLLEAMSSGVCPVVTDVGGNAAVLGPDLAHGLVPPEDPVALAGAWLRVLRDAASRKKDARTARDRVVTKFSLTVMAEAYEKLYAAQG